MSGAYEENLRCITYEAGSDLSSSQYRFVTLASDGQVDATAAAGQMIGVVQNKPAAAGRAATVAYDGISKVEASAAISIGDRVGSAASGKARTAESGDWIAGVAVTAATADGDILSVHLKCPATGTEA